MRAAKDWGRFLGFSIAFFLLSGGAWAAEPQFPPLTGRVVDQAGILSASSREQLTAMLDRHEDATGEQVVVVTLSSLQGFSIEDFGYRLGRAWGIGEKDKNTGALLIIAPSERKVRIEVGYGLEGRLTDAISRAIIESDIVPAFRQRNYDQGVLAGTAAMLGVLGSPPDAGSVRREKRENRGENLIGLLIFFVVGYFVIFIGQRRGYWTIGPQRGRYWSAGGGSFGGSSGGFSGGGGSFGGGGASGDW